MAIRKAVPNPSPQTLDLRAIAADRNGGRRSFRRKLSTILRVKKRLTIAVMSAILLIVLIVCLVIINTTAASRHSFPDTLTSAASFPLYYPAALPRGYSFNKSKASYAASVLVFTVNAPGGKTVDVSQEATPPGYDFSQIVGTDTFRTSAGTAVINYNTSFTSASIEGARTWILIRATPQVTTSDLETIMAGFVQSGT